MFEHYCCIDLEFTGLRKKDRMVSFGACEMNWDKPTGKTIHRIVNPGRWMSEKIVSIHGITNEEAAQAPFFKDVATDILHFIGDMPLVVHSPVVVNAQDDEYFFNQELSLIGLPIIAHERFVNSLPMTQRLFQKKSLDHILDYYGIDRSIRMKYGHGAEIDAVLLSQLYPSLHRDYELAVKALEKDIPDLTPSKTPNKFAELLAQWKPSSP